MHNNLNLIIYYIKINIIHAYSIDITTWAAITPFKYGIEKNNEEETIIDIKNNFSSKSL